MGLAEVSSNSYGFAAILEVRSDFGNLERAKREKVEGSITQQSSSSQDAVPLPKPKKQLCKHPGFFARMCIKCGLQANYRAAVPLRYIHKNLRLATAEINRLRDKDFKDLLCRRKLYLVLDLDHTLLHSTQLSNLKDDEAYLISQRDDLPDALKSSLFRVDEMGRVTKLRPFVYTFLEEASKLFEMYIYTMGYRPYALKMADLLDPGNKYFHSRIISRLDNTKHGQKGLDIVLGRENAVLILDDTESVWKKNKENLILMDKYHFFASSCGNYKSLSQLHRDECETEGALATVLKVLQQVHSLFFDKDHKDNLENQDVRQVLKSVRKEVLKDCKIVFPNKLNLFWGMAEQLGATCSISVDPSVTHVVSMNAETLNSRWAVREKKFLVTMEWIEASNLLWRKQPEENFLLCPKNCKE